MANEIVDGVSRIPLPCYPWRTFYPISKRVFPYTTPGSLGSTVIRGAERRRGRPSLVDGYVFPVQRATGPYADSPGGQPESARRDSNGRQATPFHVECAAPAKLPPIPCPGAAALRPPTPSGLPWLQDFRGRFSNPAFFRVPLAVPSSASCALPSAGIGGEERETSMGEGGRTAERARHCGSKSKDPETTERLPLRLRSVYHLARLLA